LLEVVIGPTGMELHKAFNEATAVLSGTAQPVERS